MSAGGAGRDKGERGGRENRQRMEGRMVESRKEGRREKRGGEKRGRSSRQRMEGWMRRVKEGGREGETRDRRESGKIT